MENVYYFISGYLLGWLTHKYSNYALYKTFLLYALIRKKYDEIIIYIMTNNKMEIANTSSLNWKDIIKNAQSIDNGLMKNVIQKFKEIGIEKSDVEFNSYISDSNQSGLLIPNYRPFYYNGKRYESINVNSSKHINRVIQHIQNNLYEPLLSADLICKMKNGEEYKVNITNQLNTILFCDGFFVFDKKLHPYWWIIWNDDKKNNWSDAESFRIEFIDRQNLIPSEISNGVLYIKEYLDRNYDLEYIDLNEKEGKEDEAESLSIMDGPSVSILHLD